MKTTFTTDKWIAIPQTARPKRTEKDEKERLKYWSSYWKQKNRVKATCSSF